MNWLKFSIRSLLALTLACAMALVFWPKPDVESEVIKQLESRNRNAVHVALWTLKNNDIETASRIDLNLPYNDNKPLLTTLIDELEMLDVADLKTLDDSLNHHWQIYSPIWGPTSENWD